jgi:hypothetical protein
VVGLFALVFGFFQAEPRGWADGVTVGSMVAGVVVLAISVFRERRARQPSLPMRVVLERNRGSSYLSLPIAGAGMLGVFCF